MATMNMMKRNLNLQFRTVSLSPIPVPSAAIISSRSTTMRPNDVEVLYARYFNTHKHLNICYWKQTSKTNQINMF